MQTMVPLYGFGGGGTALNFKVLAYATKDALLAAAPVENTIGIITNTPITSWLFSATELSPAAAGMVWITVGTYGNVGFNALKKNGIQVYPIRAKQYVSGAWVNKDVKIYQGGAWVELKNYLFNDGNQYTDVTGGWSVDGYSRNGGTLYGATVGDTMVFPYTSGNYAYVAGTQKKINLTYVDTICADVTIEEPGLSHAALVIDDDKEITSIVAQTTFHDSAGTKTVKLNVSEKTGEYYIHICTIQNKLTVRKVWME